MLHFLIISLMRCSLCTVSLCTFVQVAREKDQTGLGRLSLLTIMLSRFQEWVCCSNLCAVSFYSILLERQLKCIKVRRSVSLVGAELDKKSTRIIYIMNSPLNMLMMPLLRKTSSSYGTKLHYLYFSISAHILHSLHEWVITGKQAGCWLGAGVHLLGHH